MDEDLEGLEGRFVLFTSVDGVVSKFATEVDVSEEEVRSLLSTEVVRAPLSSQARRFAPFAATVIPNGADEPAQKRVQLWTRAPAATLSTVSEISAYEIDGHKWCTATARWLLAGRARSTSRRLDGAPAHAACTTRVLLSTTAPDKGVTVLRAQPPVPLTDEEASSIPKDEPLLEADAARLFHEDLRRLAQHLPQPDIDQQVLLRRISRSIATSDIDLSRVEEPLRSQLVLRESEALRQVAMEALARLQERELDQPDDA